MKKFMLVCYDPEMEETFTIFKNTFEEAEDARMDGEVSCGYYIEVYERQETEFGKEYVMIM